MPLKVFPVCRAWTLATKCPLSLRKGCMYSKGSYPSHSTQKRTGSLGRVFLDFVTEFSRASSFLLLPTFLLNLFKLKFKQLNVDVPDDGVAEANRPDQGLHSVQLDVLVALRVRDDPVELLDQQLKPVQVLGSLSLWVDADTARRKVDDNRLGSVHRPVNRPRLLSSRATSSIRVRSALSAFRFLLTWTNSIRVVASSSPVSSHLLRRLLSLSVKI